MHDLAKPRQPLLDDPAINKGTEILRDAPSTNIWLFTAIDGTFNPFINFDFTGTTRPVYPLSQKRTLPENIPTPDYANDGRVMGVIHQLKVTL